MAQRGVYRSLFSALFDDPDFQRLPKDCRLLVITLRQCKDAGPAAIFRYYPTTLSAQTGLSLKQVETAMRQLQAERWIEYDGAVVWVRNGLRYEPTMTLANPLHRKAIEKHLRELPKANVILSFCDYYKIAYPFEGVSIPTRNTEIETDTETEIETETDSPLTPHGGNGHRVTPTGFDRFYTAYPKHEAKESALRAWRKLAPDAALLTVMLEAIARQRAGRKWHEGFIPMPSTWLNQRRWEDEVEPTLPFDAKTASTVQAANRVIERMKGDRRDV